MTCQDCTHYAGNGKCRKNKKGMTSPLKVADDLSCFDQAAPEKPVLPEENKPETKICKGCGRELPLDAFWRNRQGVTGYCNDCMAKRRADGVKKREQNYKEREERLLAEIFPNDKKELEEARQSFQEELDRVAPVKSIKAFSDEELAAELRSRGYSGTLTKSATLNV